MKSIARITEVIIFGSRWLVVPFLFGLIAGLAVLIFKFGLKLFDFVQQIGTAEFDRRDRRAFSASSI